MTFQKGKSGNPSGRKPGSKNKKLELLRSADELLQRKILDLALEGNPTALKIVADRLWPRLRSQPPLVSIDVASNDLAEQGRKIIAAALSGKITVDVLRDLLSAIYAQGKLIELSEFEDRLHALEQSKDIPPWESDYRPVKLPPVEKLPMRGKRKRWNK